MQVSLKQTVLNALCIAWIEYRVTYARTALGALWPAMSSAAFILILGVFFGQVMDRPLGVFMPHIAWGYAIWGFIANSLSSAADLYVSQKGAFLSGRTQLFDIVTRTTARSFIDLAFQAIPALVVTVLLYHHIDWRFVWLVPSLGLLILHALWVKVVFGIICARFADIGQLIPIAVRIGFLITPIIWMPSSGRGEMLGVFMLLNPFYHVLEPLRDALLSQPPQLLSYLISASLAHVGCALAWYLSKRFSRQAMLWV